MSSWRPIGWGTISPGKRVPTGYSSAGGSLNTAGKGRTSGPLTSSRSSCKSVTSQGGFLNVSSLLFLMGREPHHSVCFAVLMILVHWFQPFVVFSHIGMIVPFKIFLDIFLVIIRLPLLPASSVWVFLNYYLYFKSKKLINKQGDCTIVAKLRAYVITVVFWRFSLVR